MGRAPQSGRDPAQGQRAFQKVARGPSLADEVATAIRRRIREDFAPGTRLPTEAELAEAFGVSRAVIREAISRLKYDGLVESIQGVGAFVSRSAAASFRLEVAPLASDTAALAAIFELRQTFEVGAARLAALRRTDEQLARLRTDLDRMGMSRGADPAGVTADIDFHIGIAEATGNSYFMDFATFLSAQLSEAIQAARANSARRDVQPATVQEEHEAIFAAIKAQNPEEAMAATARHIASAAERLGFSLP